MADNITAPAAGAVLATDEIGGVHYPRTKISFGVDGAVIDVSAGAPLPVVAALPNGASSAAKQDAILAALSTVVDGLAAVITAIGNTTYFPPTQPVSGTVALDGASLAALETTELGAATLASLENITVAGPLTNAELRAASVQVSTTQAAPAQVKETITADTPKTVLAADANRAGCRILNYTSSPIYITQGTAGTPPSGAESDYIPAAAGGVPGQWEAPYRPTLGLRAVGAVAGDLTVVSW